MGTNGDPVHFDRQQALVVERLRAADGAAVSFRELRAAGIENPALVCYELEAIGVPLTRTSSPGEGMPALSVRIEARGRAQEPVAEVSRPSAAGETFHRAIPRLVPALALAAVLAALIAIVVSGGSGSARPGTQRGAAPRPPAQVAGRIQAPHRRAGPARKSEPVAPAAAAPVAPAAPRGLSPAQAASLQAEGHRLLAGGSYGPAVARLLAAIRASRQSLAACVEPASDTCLTFAYALYDLGRALRLRGDHAAAIAILRKRLLIDDQRPVVRHELDLARGASA